MARRVALGVGLRTVDVIVGALVLEEAQNKLSQSPGRKRDLVNGAQVSHKELRWVRLEAGGAETLAAGARSGKLAFASPSVDVPKWRRPPVHEYVQTHVVQVDRAIAAR